MNKLIILALIASLTTSAAHAHAMLDAASPRVGAKVAAPPTEISLTFSERVEASLSTISLSASSGDDVALSETGNGASSHVLVARILRPLNPGRYRVRWSVLSSDGHSTAGDFVFTVAD